MSYFSVAVLLLLAATFPETQQTFWPGWPFYPYYPYYGYYGYPAYTYPAAYYQPAAPVYQSPAVYTTVMESPRVAMVESPRTIVTSPRASMSTMPIKVVKYIYVPTRPVSFCNVSQDHE
ncbi:spore coat protein T domain protein [Ancylostoma ceylanicum]|uniref:Spore coat protein T domain protein n=1 Tax=Ancylostoma ceylanicum TaxID=53326 RepID=A0A0D6MC00_9BILA|nr:spore coat protein T domain protein [Ancylostoma ceylanicum]